MAPVSAARKFLNAMTFIYERQFWCEDCKRSHMVKVYSNGELSDGEKSRLFVKNDYGSQLRKHAVCRRCGRNITPHTDIDLVADDGEWREICLDCLRTG